MNQAKQIDLSAYQYAGEGANGTSYNHGENPDVMLKMYNASYPAALVVQELEMAQNVYAAGIPSPKPGELVTDGERYGILFRRIRNKCSFARAIGQHPEKVEQYAVEFARLSKQLHATPVDTNKFPDVKEQYKEMLAQNPYYTSGERKKVAAFIDAAPAATNALHGDLSFGNLLMSGDERYFIDLGEFAYGYFMFDLSMVYITCVRDEPAFIREAFHMEPDTALRFWHWFVPAYFGADVSMADVEREVIPYAGVKSLLIERNVQESMPRFRNLLYGTVL